MLASFDSLNKVQVRWTINKLKTSETKMIAYHRKLCREGVERSGAEFLSVELLIFYRTL